MLPGGRYTGQRTRGGVPIEDCAFCSAGHLTGPGSARRLHYLQQRVLGNMLGGFMACDRYVYQIGHPAVRCDRELEWVEDYGEPVAAAWALGGAEAAYDIIRQAWPHSDDLEPR